MPKTIHFNTGRLYSAQGQRITATLHDDGVTTFYDHDRMIDGELNSSGSLLADFEVMSWYDGGHWRSTQRSRADGPRPNRWRPRPGGNRRRRAARRPPSKFSVCFVQRHLAPAPWQSQFFSSSVNNTP